MKPSDRRTGVMEVSQDINAICQDVDSINKRGLRKETIEKHKDRIDVERYKHLYTTSKVDVNIGSYSPQAKASKDDKASKWGSGSAEVIPY